MGSDSKKKVKITLTIDPEILRRLDKLCEVKGLSRPQVVEMLLSPDPKTVAFMTDLVNRIDSEMFI